MISEQYILDGLWKLTSPEMPGAEIAMSVPGDNYSALLAEKIIPDPYWGTNEKRVQKYAAMQWDLERDFFVEEDFLKYRKILLELERLDTLVSVFVNGRKVLSCDNMFCRYRIDVRQYLVPGRNLIKFVFHPVVPECAKRNRKLPVLYSYLFLVLFFHILFLVRHLFY